MLQGQRLGHIVKARSRKPLSTAYRARAFTREAFIARLPTPDEVALLKLPDGVAIIDLIHTGIDQNREPFEVTTFTMRGDLVGLDYTMPIEQ